MGGGLGQNTDHFDGQLQLHCEHALCAGHIVIALY